MKKFSINCDFGGQMAPFDFYIGHPEKEHHPLHFQADWLTKQRGGSIPPEVMNAIAKLKDIAEKNNVSLEDLCVYAIGSWDKTGEEAVSSEPQIEQPNEDTQDDSATDVELSDQEAIVTPDLSLSDDEQDEELGNEEAQLQENTIKSASTSNAKAKTTAKRVQAKAAKTTKSSVKKTPAKKLTKAKKSKSEEE